ncbi:MAG TPA: dTMP kinase, partial [Bacillota bacterium]
SGKSTQIDFTRRFLEARGVPVTVTREPGGTPLGQRLRALLLGHHGDGAAMAPTTELLLLAADRAEHVAKVIRPALACGRVVISDRYADSTVAYQGFGLGLDLEAVASVNRVATEGLEPDLTILLDVPVAMLQQRARGVAFDRIEARGDDFYERVRQGFLFIAQNESRRFVVLDGTQPPSVLQKRLTGILEEHVLSRVGPARPDKGGSGP